MRAKDHLHDLLTGMRAEIRRLRRVVRAAVARQKAREAYRDGGSWDALAKANKSLERAVAAYRKWKKKHD